MRRNIRAQHTNQFPGAQYRHAPAYLQHKTARRYVLYASIHFCASTVPRDTETLNAFCASRQLMRDAYRIALHGTVRASRSWSVDAVCGLELELELQLSV